MNRPEIWTPVRAETMEEAEAQLKVLAEHPLVDKAEVWMDGIEDLDIPDLFSKSPIPTIAANKMPADKGKFRGTYDELARDLVEAAQHGASMVALPIHTPENLFGEVRDSLDRIFTRQERLVPFIGEYHDWEKTPSDMQLREIAALMEPYVDVVKMAVTPNSEEDVQRMFEFAAELQRKDIKHILISMKDLGRETRIRTPLMGGIGMFAPVTLNGATAGGQLTVQELHEAWSDMEGE